jgi:hypothetical protein
MLHTKEETNAVSEWLHLQDLECPPLGCNIGSGCIIQEDSNPSPSLVALL